MTTLTITENTTVQNGSPDSSQTGITDTELYADAATINYETKTTIEVTKFAVLPNHRDSLVKPDLTGIPANAPIVSAYLYMYLSGADITATDISVRGLLRDVVYTETTWNIWKTGNNWTTGGGRSNGNDRDSAAIVTQAVGVTTGVWHAFPITSWVQDVVDGTRTNYGLHLERTDSEADDQYRVFQSSEGTDGQRPEVYIEYGEKEARINMYDVTTAGGNWNETNSASTGSVSSDLTEFYSGGATGWTLDLVVAGSPGVDPDNRGATVTLTGSAAWAEDAKDDGWIHDDDVVNETSTWTFGGLNNSAEYAIEVYGGTNLSNVRDLGVTIGGSEQVITTGSNNASVISSHTGISPTGGEIVVLCQEELSSQASCFLNAMRIIQTSSPAAVSTPGIQVYRYFPGATF